MNTNNDVVKEMLRRAGRAANYWREQFDIARICVKYIKGEQWDEAALRERKAEKRPAFVVNKLQQYVNRVVGAQRQNAMMVKLIPTKADFLSPAQVKPPFVNGSNPPNQTMPQAGLAGDQPPQQMQGQGVLLQQMPQQAPPDSLAGGITNLAGTKTYSLAQVFEGIVSQIQYASDSVEHYKVAFRHAVEGGIGFLRVYTDYVNNKSFTQDIKIKAIRNRWGVLIDPNAQEPDFSDMNWAIIIDSISKDEFKKLYPDKQIGSFGIVEEGHVMNAPEDQVKIAEYFVRTLHKRKIVLLSDGTTHYWDEIKDVYDQMRAEGLHILREREVDAYKVKWYKMSAWDILEETEWVGDTIPIIPVVGREIDIDSKRFFKSVVYDALDAQKLLNYWLTASTERVALAPKAPWVAPAKAIEGFEDIWQTANIKNWSVLPYNELPSGARPQREPPAQMPSAEINLAMLADEHIKSSTGIYDAALGQRTNEISGRAILARSTQSDTGTYDFIDNLNIAIKRIGKILVQIIPKVYDTQRIVRIRFDEDHGDWVEINKTYLTPDGRRVVVNDISVGEYDVYVDIQPSAYTKRQETARAIMEFAQAIPQVAQVAPDLVAKNMDFPNAKQIAERLRKTLPPQLLSKEEVAAMQQDSVPSPPSPEEVKMQLEAQKLELENEIKKMQIEIEETRLENERLKTLAMMEQNAGSDKALKSEIKSLIEDALTSAMSNGANGGGENGGQNGNAGSGAEPEQPTGEPTGEPAGGPTGEPTGE